MGVFSPIFGINEATQPKEITFEEYMFCVVEANIEYFLNEDSSDSDFEDLVHEGANLEYRRAFKSGKKKFKEAIRNIKKATKEKRYDDARSHVKKAKEALNDIEKVLKETDSTTGSNILAFFATGLLVLVRVTLSMTILTGVTKAAPITGMSGSYVYGYSEGLNLLKTIDQICSDIKSKEITTDQAYNLYRNKLCICVKNMKSELDKVSKNISAKESKEK